MQGCKPKVLHSCCLLCWMLMQFHQTNKNIMVLHLQGGCRVVPGQKICRKQQLEGTRQGKIKDLWMKLSCFRCYKNSLVLPFGTVHKSKTIMKLNLILIGKDGHCVAFEDDSWRAVSTQHLESLTANPCCHHFILQIVLMNVHWCTRHCGALSGNMTNDNSSPNFRPQTRDETQQTTP